MGRMSTENYKHDSQHDKILTNHLTGDWAFHEIQESWVVDEFRDQAGWMASHRRAAESSRC